MVNATAVWILFYFFIPGMGTVNDAVNSGKTLGVFQTQKSCLDQVQVLQKSNSGYGVCVEGFI